MTMAEIENSLTGDVLMGLMQALGAIVLCAIVVLLCRLSAVRVEREAAISLARGLVQMILVGLVLALLLHGSLLVGALILLSMSIGAAVTAARRLKGLQGALMLCFWSIAAGAGTVIAAMLSMRSLRPDVSILVPVGSMIIANAMNSCAQAIERFRAEILAHLGHVEAALSLGAEPAVSVAPYLQSAVYASLLPRLDMMKSHSRRHGRHGGVGHEPALCGHLPVHRGRDDPRGLRHHRPCRDGADAKAGVLRRGAVDVAAGGGGRASLILTRHLHISPQRGGARNDPPAPSSRSVLPWVVSSRSAAVTG
jgi:putative ABC transport system permease protein